MKRLFLGFCIWLCPIWGNAAELTAQIQIIAHPSVQVETLSQAQLRSIYLMRQVVWPDGVAIRVFTLPARSAANLQFCREQLQMFPYQLERVWQKLTYSGTGTPPTELQDLQVMLQTIAATPGAIGYIEKQDETQVVKVIPIKL